ncbi:MAG: class I SAM-dependent RNA methyltransferase, partial [Hyphomonas sp.]
MPEKSDRPGAAARRLSIVSLGAQGDGRAEENGERVSVPFTLAGETVQVDGEGERLRLVEVLQASPDRCAPRCRHFGRCGGCTLQHMASAPYAAFKRDLILRALNARGLKADVAETWVTPPASRRRAPVAARRAG